MIAEKKVAESRQERQRLMVARRMNPAFVPTNSRRVFFFSGRYKMSRMLSEIVDSDPADRMADLYARLREEPEADEDDEEDDDDKEDQDNDGDSDGYSE